MVDTAVVVTTAIVPLTQYIVVPTLCNWWTGSGAVPGGNCIIAYQPIGADSFADSKINLANPGTYDAGDGANAPTWDDINGWAFDQTQHLTTGYTPNKNCTTLVRYVLDGDAVSSCIFGAQPDTSNTYHIWAIYSSSTAYWRNGGSYSHAYYASGVYGLVGLNAYHDDDFLSTISDDAHNFGPLTIGVMYPLAPAASAYYYFGTIQAVAVYDITLTSDQVAAVVTEMLAL